MVEDFQRQRFGGLGVVCDPQDQRENHLVRPVVEGIQSQRIAGGNPPNEADPVVFGYGHACRGCIEEVAQSRGHRLGLILVQSLCRIHKRGWRADETLSRLESTTVVG